MTYTENIKLMSDDLINTIKKIFKDNIYATKAIKISLKANKDWDDEKRAYFSETIYDITRYWRLLWYLARKEQSFNSKDLESILNVYLFFKGEKVSESSDLVKRLFYARKIRALRESIPDWLDELGQKELGKNWNQVIKALNKKPDLKV